MMIKKETITLFVRGLGRGMHRSNLLNACYGVAMVLIILGIAGGLIHSLSFLVRMFNQVLLVSKKDIRSEVTMFDISGLLSLSSRLGISIPAVSSPPHLSPSSPISTVSPAASPEVSPADLGSLYIQILNNTTIAGRAKQWRERFTTAGFTNIEIGNIRSGNYRNIHIRYAPQNKQFIEKVKEILSSFQAIIEGETEDSSLSNTIVIIIGKSE